MATRVDAPLHDDDADEEATRAVLKAPDLAPAPRVVPAAGVRAFNSTMPLQASPLARPPAPSAPLLNLAGAGQATQSAPANLSSPQFGAVPSFGGASPSQPLAFAPPVAAALSLPMAPPEAPAKRKLPLWTLAIPAAIIAVAALMLAVRFVSQSATGRPVAPPPSAKASAAVSAPTPPVSAAATVQTLPPPSAAVSVSPPPPSPPAVTAVPSAPASAKLPPPPVAPPRVVKPVATATATATAAPRPAPVPLPKPAPKKPPVDNSEFGGRK
jgi:hypothetical protein